ncbi:MAG: NRDE family protein [Phycisphaerae bacterium]|nr:NRDE family protein [Phycisphaerae bacterium]
MCTLSFIPVQHGLRIVMNRDELRTRPPGRPPIITPIDPPRAAIHPIDPLSGGTWIAASNAGLSLALMNLNPTPAPPPPRPDRTLSRGLVIPTLISQPNATNAIDRLRTVELDRYAPFRLAAADHGVIITAEWDRQALRVECSSHGPRCFVSSGLGDARVAARHDLFQRFLASHGASPEAQDAFHRHEWPHQPEISVRMSREDARTVSITTIEPTIEGGLRMTYSDDAGSCALALPPIMLESARA